MYSRLVSFSLAWSHRQVFSFALQRLNSSHFVNADGSFSCFGSFPRTQVGVADIDDFIVERKVGGGFNQ
jgi:hypothetical protein